MKKIIYILIIVFSIASCVTDDTVHEFETLGDINIAGLEDFYTFNYLEEATVEPDVTFANGLSDDNVEYRWYMYTPQSAFLADTISREKNINSVISSPPRDDYNLVFSIKDLTTGVVLRKVMSAEVLGPFSRGMMVLSETNGIRDINFIRPDSLVFYNVFANTNPGETIGTMPNKVQWTNPTFRANRRQVFIYSNDSDGGVALDPVSFKKQRTFRESFFNFQGATLNTELYFPYFRNDYVLVNGKLHNRSAFDDDFWKPALIITDLTIPLDYHLAPFFFNVNSNFAQFPIVHDNLNGRLLKHDPSNRGELTQYGDGDTSAFDYNDTGLKLYYGGRTSVSGFRGVAYFGIGEAMDDPTKRQLIAFYYNSRGGGLITSTNIELPESSFPGLHQSTLFTTTNLDLSTRGILWYSDGKKLYALNTADATPSEIVVRDFEAEGMTVDVLKMESAELRIAVRNSSGAGLIYMDASTIGGINAEETYNSFGADVDLGDKIIDFDYKLN